MARIVAIGVIVGVLTVLIVSALGVSVLANAPTPALSEIHTSIAPAVNPPPSPFFTGMAASVALGARNLTSDDASDPPNASTFVPDPELSCAGSNGTIWVPDYPVGRVLEFKPPFSTGENASVVIGQSTFNGVAVSTTATNLSQVAACTFDSHGDLWVSDDGANRVLEYVPPFTNGKAASLVLGQTGFTTNVGGTTKTNLSGPTGMSFDAQGNLWVVDTGNRRILEFVPPFSDGMAASLALGQTSFLAGNGGTSATNLSEPLDVAVSGGIVWVADYLNERVVGFAAPFSMGEGATYLLGQQTFVSTGATGPGALLGPTGVSVDAHGNLWVSDTVGNRVHEFLPPFTAFENATVAIGQKSLTAATANTTATTLNYPLGAFVAPSGALWVTDSGNSRALEYLPNSYSVTFAAAGLPSIVNLTVTVGGSIGHGPGPNFTLSEENGSYLWSVSPIAGYQFSPTSGNFSVNGHNVIVTLTVKHLAYTIEFLALGLPASTNWTIVLAGVTHSSPNNGPISFNEANGTYGFTASTVTGYNVTPKSGSIVVNGSSQDVNIAFPSIPSPAAASSSSSSSNPYGGALGLLLLIVAAVVGLVVGFLIGRRRKGGSAVVAAPTAAWTSPPTASSPPAPPPPPPGAGGPPPGAMG